LSLRSFTPLRRQRQALGQLRPPRARAAPFCRSSQGLKKFAVARGFKVEVFAAEPLLQNPVSIAFDERGRLYVVETHRRRTSVFDIRNFPEWLDSDFSLRTVDDRLNFLKRTVVPENQPFIER
jgi:quinoprotein glucose dehydrogenase